MKNIFIKISLPLLSLALFTNAFSPSVASINPLVEQGAFLNIDEIKTNHNQNEPKIKKIMFLNITGYSSSFDETDDTPWITAYNTPVRDGIAASNILPFGTKIRIPRVFGNKIFIIEDKMNQRFNEHIDIWFPSKEEALNFGIYYDVLVEILE
ncbi:MAG: hypothetical protein KatS3mg097_367 [Candidatus Parcubacteria bacterium]|nr:MAG: hypothetical protein KatS3mg097_367 [Candidatus Parcubacteria bacterium]